ncbi:hypothetical protein [Acinetobacter oleivorans]
MIKKRNLISILTLIFFIATDAKACLFGDLKEKNMQLIPIGKNTILNGSTVQMFNLFSPSCSLECYMRILNEKNLRFTKQGSLFYIGKEGGVTLQLLSLSNNAMSARVICKAKNKLKYIQLPNYIKLSNPSTDFQSEDNGSVSRTMMFKNFKKNDYLNLVHQIQKQAKTSDLNSSFSYFELKDGSEVNLIFDMRKLINNLVVVYVEKSISHA